MKKAIIIPNNLKERSKDFAASLKTLLESRGYITIILEENEAYTDEAEFAIALGGDGTMIRASKQLCSSGIPLLGINFGHLGYLTECNPENAIETVNSVMDGNYRIENRLMLDVEIIRKGEIVGSFIALNEAALNRATLMKAFKMEIYINGKHTNTVLGDGVLVATPTGSTSYNLSAGGPILTPTANNMVITQIAPIYFPGTPLVTDGNDVIEIKAIVENPNKKGSVQIELDGSESFSIENGDIIRIKRSESYARIIKVEDRSFYQILKEKLSKANL